MTHPRESGQGAERAALRKFVAALDSGAFQNPEVVSWIEQGLPVSFAFRSLARLKRGELEGALADAIEAASRAPDSALMATVACRVGLLSGDYRLAFEQLGRVRSLIPGAAAFFDLQFELAERLDWLREAEEAYRQAEQCAPGLVSRHLRLARLYRRHGRLESALEQTRLAIHLAPASVELRLSEARLLALLKRPAEERTALLSASACVPDDASVRVEAGRRLCELACFDDARQQLDEAGRLAPARAEPAALTGRTYLWEAETARAIEHAEAALRLDPRAADGWMVRGGARVLKGELVEALEDLERAVTLAPSNQEAAVWRAEALSGLGRHEEASRAAHRTRESVGEYLAASLVLVLSQLRRKEGTFHKTGRRENLRVRRKYVYDELFPGLSVLVPNADRLLESEDPAEAEGLLKAGLEAFAGNRSPAPVVRDPAQEGGLAWRDLGSCLRFGVKHIIERIRFEEPEALLRELEQIARDNPDSPLPLTYRGELLLWLGRYEEARSCLERAIAIFQPTRWAYVGLGACHLFSGEPERALEIFDLGLRTLPGTGDPPTMVVFRGEAHRRLGHAAEAVQDLERATQLHPTRLSAPINLALAYGLAGDDAAQRRMFHHVLERGPGLLLDAARELGISPWGGADGVSLEQQRQLLSHALVMMRGNRSSNCIIYFLASGERRTMVPIPPKGKDDILSDIRAMLERSFGLRSGGHDRGSIRAG